MISALRSTLPMKRPSDSISESSDSGHVDELGDHDPDDNNQLADDYTWENIIDPEGIGFCHVESIRDPA
jgi:hypothetical protein